MNLAYLTKEGKWEQNPPDLQAELVSGKRGRLLVTIYRAGGAKLHPTVLLSHGFPGIEKNIDLAQALRRIGFHVVLYHYSGSWGSDGAYAYTHNLEDADTILEFIETNSTYGFDLENLFVVGHSVGGFVTAHLFAKHPKLRAAVLLAPCDLGAVVAFPEETKAKRLLREIFETGPDWLNGTSSAALYEEVFAQQTSYRIAALLERIQNRPLYCLGAVQDESCPPEAHCLPWVEALRSMGGRIIYEELDTDHSFSDARLRMIEKTAQFLVAQVEE